MRRYISKKGQSQENNSSNSVKVSIIYCSVPFLAREIIVLRRRRMHKVQVAQSGQVVCINDTWKSTLTTCEIAFTL